MWILLLIRDTVFSVYTFVVNLVAGLWLLFTQPVTFMRFVAEWRRFEKKIAEKDELANNEIYMSMNRQQRRAMGKAVRS